MDHKLNTQCTPVLWLNSNWTHIEHILEIDWAKIEHGLFDLALIEQQMYTYWPQILQLDLYWTWVEHKLNMYCTPVLRLNPNWTQIEHHFLNWTQIEHGLNTHLPQILWFNPYWTQIEPRLHTYCTPIPRLNPN